MKNNLKHLFIRTLILSTTMVSTSIYANTLATQPDDRRLQDEKTQDFGFNQPKIPLSKPIRPTEEDNKSEEKIIHLSEAELVQNPKLLANALMSAILYNNEEDVRFLLPLYQQLDAEVIDTDLLTWAQAVDAHAKKEYELATKHYQKLVNQYPDNQILGLRLAVVMFQNRDFKGAKIHLVKAQDELNGKNPILQNTISQYLQQISELEQWHLKGGASYLSDKNINNSPKNPNISANFTAQKPESAHGVYANINTSKKIFFNDGFFSEIEIGSNGKLYWDNKKYNELNYRTSLGAGWQNHNHTVSIAPFWEQTLYAGGNKNNDSLDPFSTASGLTFEWQNRLKPDFQLTLASEYASTSYETRTHLDGKSYLANISGLYFISPAQYLLTGVDYHRTITRDDDDSFQRQGIRFAWGKQWENGLSSRVSLNYAQRQYDGPMPIFNKIQDNKEYALQTSLGHKRITLFGIQPKLTWQYNRVDSNIPLYNYDKNRIFIEIDKQF